MTDWEQASHKVGMIRDVLLIILFLITLLGLLGATLLIGSIPTIAKTELQGLSSMFGGAPAGASAGSGSRTTGGTAQGPSVADQARIAGEYAQVARTNPQAASLLTSALTKSQTGDAVGMVSDIQSLEQLLITQGNTAEAAQTHELYNIITGQQSATDEELQAKVESLLTALGE